MLELKHICYSVHDGSEQLDILKDISLTIDDHRLVVFTGPNGGSMTTFGGGWHRDWNHIPLSGREWRFHRRAWQR